MKQNYLLHIAGVLLIIWAMILPYIDNSLKVLALALLIILTGFLCILLGFILTDDKVSKE